MSSVPDTVIHSGVVVDEFGPRVANLVLGDGRVQDVLPPHDVPAAEHTIDASGLLVLPGFVDTHTHFRDPSNNDREDFRSGTSAAAGAGVTTVLEMPISSPGVGTAEIFTARAEHCAAQALVDFGLYGGAGFENLDDIQRLADAGAVAFKTFLHPPAVGRESEFRGLWCRDNADIYDAVRAVARTGRVHAFHCEDHHIEHRLRERLPAGQARDPRSHAETKPLVVEDVAVASVLAIAADIGARVQIAHLSSPRAALMVANAKAAGVQATSEVCPNHLFLTEDDLVRHGPFAKCNPPLRDAASVSKLWDELGRGTIDVIGSDHAPFTSAEKSAGCEDIFAAPPGIAAIELTLPLLLSAVKSGRLDLAQLVSLTSARAASLFGLAAKGRLIHGADADLVLVDPDVPWTYRRSESRSKSGDTLFAYDGLPLQGRAITTMVRGVVVFDDGEVVGEPGHGRLVTPR